MDISYKVAIKLGKQDHYEKKPKTLAADTQAVFRIIQSIPSLKVEPFKLWMAKVAKERLDQMQDPKLSIDQAMTDHKRLGYLPIF